MTDPLALVPDAHRPAVADALDAVDVRPSAVEPVLGGASGALAFRVDDAGDRQPVLVRVETARDLFRSPELSGWSKAIWTIFIIVLPYLGVFVYLVARGHKMSEHAVAQAQAIDTAQRDYIQSVVGSSSPADELAKAAALRDKGVIDDAEFQAMKAKILGATS